MQKGGSANKFGGSLRWIEDADIVGRHYNFSLHELQLDGNAVQDVFKVYMQDVGLFVSMLEDSTQVDILQDNLYDYKRAIKLGDYNVERTEKTLTFPLYLTFSLTEY